MSEEIKELTKKVDKILFFFEDDPNLKGHEGIFTKTIKNEKKLDFLSKNVKDNQDSINENSKEIKRLRKSHKLRERFKMALAGVTGIGGGGASVKAIPALKAFGKELLEWVTTW